MPQLISIIEICHVELREFFLGQFSKFASIIRTQLKPFMKDIFNLIKVKTFLVKKNLNFRKRGIGRNKEITAQLLLKF